MAECATSQPRRFRLVWQGSQSRVDWPIIAREELLLRFQSMLQATAYHAQCCRQHYGQKYDTKYLRVHDKHESDKCEDQHQQEFSELTNQLEPARGPHAHGAQLLVVYPQLGAGGRIQKEPWQIGMDTECVIGTRETCGQSAARKNFAPTLCLLWCREHSHSHIRYNAVRAGCALNDYLIANGFSRPTFCSTVDRSADWTRTIEKCGLESSTSAKAFRCTRMGTRETNSCTSVPSALRTI